MVRSCHNIKNTFQLYKKNKNNNHTKNLIDFSALISHVLKTQNLLTKIIFLRDIEMLKLRSQ